MLRLLCLMWSVYSLRGQGYSPWPHHIRFEGVVVEFPSGEPIADVAVSASKCDRKTMTDAAGRFALECPYTIDNGPGFTKQGYSLHGVQGQGIESSDADGNPIRRQIVRQMWAPGKIVGRVTDFNGSPARNVVVSAEPTVGAARQQSAKTGADGSFQLLVAPASYRLCVTAEFDSIPEHGTPPGGSRYVPVSSRFSSAPDRNQAVVVTAIATKDAGPFLIRLPRERIWSIAGRILTEVPRTPDWTTRIWAIGRPKVDAAFPSPEFYRAIVDDQKGSFAINGLRTGLYTLLVRAGPANQCYTCLMPPEYEERIPIQVNRDTTGMVVSIRPFSIVTGHASAPPGGAGSVILDTGIPSRFSIADRISAKVDTEGSFRIERVPPGRYLVSQSASEAQFLRTVLLEGRPVVHGEIQIVPGSSLKLEIAFRESAAMLAVRVEGDSSSDPGELLSVVAVPEDGWNDPAAWAGPIQVMNGARLTLGVARPGVYLVFATRNLAVYRVQEWAATLKRHEQQAARVTAPGGATITLKQLKLNFE